MQNQTSNIYTIRYQTLNIRYSIVCLEKLYGKRFTLLWLSLTPKRLKF